MSVSREIITLGEVQERILNDVVNNELTVLIAPTGFGKSTLFVHNLKYVTNGRKVGLIHVLPLRSILKDLVTEYVNALVGGGLGDVGDVLGYQASIGKMEVDVDGGVIDVPKDPYMLRPIVVTTYDSAVMINLAAPLTELYRGLAHWDLALMPFVNRFIMFDEAHILLKVGDEALTTEFENLIKPLAIITSLTSVMINDLNSNVIWSSASIAPTLVNILYNECGRKGFKVIVVGGDVIRDIYSKSLNIPKEFVRYIDIFSIEGFKDLISNYLSKLRTVVTTKDILSHDIINLVKELTQQGLNVLIVLNTVVRAIHVYKKMKQYVETTPILIHGRFIRSVKERKVDEVKKCIEKDQGCLVISTQVLEAGVNLSFDVLITEIASLESLIQRFGRVLRSKEHILSNRSKYALGIISVSKESMKSAYAVYGKQVIDKVRDMLIQIYHRGRSLCKDTRLTQTLKPIGKEMCIDWRYGVSGPHVVSIYNVLSQIDSLMYSYVNILNEYLNDFKSLIDSLYVNTYASMLIGECMSGILENLETKLGSSPIRESALIPLVVFRDKEPLDVVEVSANYLKGYWRKIVGQEPEAVLRICLYDIDQCFHYSLNLRVLDIRIWDYIEKPLTTTYKVISKVCNKVSRCLKQYSERINISLLGLKCVGGYDEEYGLNP